MNNEQKPMAAVPSSVVTEKTSSFLREFTERGAEIEAARISTDEVYQRFRIGKARGIYDKWAYARPFAYAVIDKAKSLAHLAAASEHVLMTSRDLHDLEGLSVDAILESYERSRARYQEDIDSRDKHGDSVFDGREVKTIECRAPTVVHREESRQEEPDVKGAPKWWVLPFFVGVVVALVALFSN